MGFVRPYNFNSLTGRGNIIPSITYKFCLQELGIGKSPKMFFERFLKFSFARKL
jgi:hypothetical protein